MQAETQENKTAYPSMAPFEQHLMAEPNVEIALAPELFQKRKSSSTVTQRLAAFFCVKMLKKAHQSEDVEAIVISVKKPETRRQHIERVRYARNLKKECAGLVAGQA